MIFQSLCTSFKTEILSGTHDLTSDDIKLALYTDDAELLPSTTAYTTTGEASGTNYTAGGASLTVNTPTAIGTTVVMDFEDLEFSNVTMSGVQGALIYNASKANRAIAVLDFGIPQSRTAASLWVRFPEPTESDAVVRIQ